MIAERKAFVYAGLAVLAWSTVPTAFKIGLRSFSPPELILYASGVSAVIFLVILSLQKKVKKVTSMSGRQWLFSFLLGALNPALYYIVLFKAYSLLPAQLAQPLNMIWPVVLALLSIVFLRQKIGWAGIGGMLVSFCGIVVISMRGSLQELRNTNVNGVALALLTSVLWSVYWILNVKDKRDETVKLFLNFCFGFFILLVVNAAITDFQLKPTEGYLAATYIGIFETGITYFLWLKAMKLSNNNSTIGNLVFFAPFVSLIFVSFILHEKIFATTIPGMVLLVAGLLVQQLDRKQKHPDGRE